MFNAEKLTIANAINDKNLQIPFFQRGYVWEEEDYENYWESMEKAIEPNFSAQIFMGTIVLKQEETSTGERFGNIRLVIDGQQRLITTFLFFKAMCTIAKNERFFERKFYKEFANGDKCILLSASRDDKNAFDEIVKNIDICEISDEIKDTKIYKCYEYFYNKAIKEKEEKEELNKRLDNFIDKVCFVVIDLDKEDDEQAIFNTINDLGQPLTTAELLKNHLFNKGKGQEEEYENYWAETFEKERRDFWDRDVPSVREDKKNIEIFFQAFFNLCNEDATKESYTKLSSLYAKYKSFLKNNEIDISGEERIRFLKNMQAYGDLYYKNIDDKVIEQAVDKESNLQKITTIIFSLKITSVIPYILYILKNTEGVERNEMFSLIENYIIRRILCNMTGKGYSSTFGTLHRKAGNYEKLKKWMCENIASGELASEFPNNQCLKNSFNKAKLTNINAKVILYFIERYSFNENNSLRLLPINSYSVEHIMPKKWDAKWHLADKSKVNDRNDAVKKIGNLTILTGKLNSAMKNSGWERKKKGNGTRDTGLIDCCEGLKTLRDYLKCDEWNEEQIDKRTEELCEQAIKVWAEPTTDK